MRAAAIAASIRSISADLAVLGAALGRSVTSDRGRRITGVVSGLVIAALAVRTLLGG